MEPLIDVLSQLKESERNEFTSWFSSLRDKEREAVASVFARTDTQRIRTLLGVKRQDRVALFLVKRGAANTVSDEVKSILRELNRQAELAADRLEKYNDSLEKKIANVPPSRGLFDPIEKVNKRMLKRRERGFFGRLFGINIKF
jgi:hypothetical protein